MDSAKQRKLFFALLVFLASLFTVIWLIIHGNENQLYDDIVVEYTSIFSSNKSAENQLLYILLFGGLILYSLFIWFQGKKQNENGFTDAIPDDANNLSKEYLFLLCIIAGAYYFVYSTINPLILAVIFCMGILFITDKSLVMSGFYFIFLLNYAIYAVYRIYVWQDGTKALNLMTAALISVVIFGLILQFNNVKKALQRACLAVQIIIPFVLLVYTASKYKYGDEFITVEVPFSVKLFIAGLIVLAVAQAVYALLKNWTRVVDIGQCITWGTCVSFLGFNAFAGSGAIMPKDMHHPFENIIGFSQIFELGQTPFKEYIPVSGLYSVVQGAIFKVFGYGELANYNITENIFYLLVVLLIVTLLMWQIDAKYVFFIALTFEVMNYNRIIFILPIMLLLSMPKIIEKKNLWLKLWFLTSFVHGLYYPLFGVSVCLAFLPLGIWQLITFIRSEQFAQQRKRIMFWIGWLVCLVPVILGIPLLWGTYRHMKAMAGQSVMADGISRFGQTVAGNFFGYLKDFTAVRLGLYDIFTFIIPVVFVWAAFAVVIKVGEIKFGDKRIQINNIEQACVAFALVIMPMIAYSFTFTRLDFGSLCARCNGVLLAGTVMLFVYYIRYLSNKKNKYAILMLIVLIPALINKVGFFENESKLYSYYTVPKNYVYVAESSIERLGTGFIEEATLNSITRVDELLKDFDRNQGYLGIQHYFGYYYLLGLKGDSVMELAATVKSYEATQETVDNIRNNRTIVGEYFSTLGNYYLYHWLITSGEYIWEPNKRLFVPNDSGLTQEEIKEKNKRIVLSHDEYDLGKNSNSFGLSMDKLAENFSYPDVDFIIKNNVDLVEVVFSKPIDGDEIDFMYVEFADMDKDFQYSLYNGVQDLPQEENHLSNLLMRRIYNPGMTVLVQWFDEDNIIHSMKCEMCQGKLLLPLGSGLRWLFNEHSNLYISVLQDGEVIDMPVLQKIEFLKLQEIK